MAFWFIFPRVSVPVNFTVSWVYTDFGEAVSEPPTTRDSPAPAPACVAPALALALTPALSTLAVTVAANTLMTPDILMRASCHRHTLTVRGLRVKKPFGSAQHVIDIEYAPWDTVSMTAQHRRTTTRRIVLGYTLAITLPLTIASMLLGGSLVGSLLMAAFATIALALTALPGDLAIAKAIVARRRPRTRHALHRTA